MSSVPAILKSQIVLIVVFFICVNCAELPDSNVSDVKLTLNNTNTTQNFDKIKNNNDSYLFVDAGEKNSITDSKPTQPETEEDLLSEMEELFKAMQLLGLDFDRNTSVTEDGRGMMSEFMFNPVMLVPQLITWGFAPIILANLKMFVMQALMLNKMALNAAIFMTLRNIVFGPRPGPIVKYANHGYHHSNHHRPPS